MVQQLQEDCCDKQPTVKRLRWDHADIPGYYHSTELYLQPILSKLCQLELGSGSDHSGRASPECVYESIVFALQDSASKYVLTHHVNFYKFWWSQELSCLTGCGRTLVGRDLARYFPAAVLTSDTNELNDALLLKRGNEFWKCWNSKFSAGAGQSKQVDGLTDHQQIADNFEQESSAKLTNQRVSYAFTSSLFSFHARHILPTS